MKSIIVWCIIIIGEIAGAYLIFAGFKIRVQCRSEFMVKQLFKKIPIHEHSGAHLIIEGVVVMLSGLLLYYAFFLW
jgi:hypothetical protein